MELQGLVLPKEGILSTEISICKSCHNCLFNNKMPKLALTNGLWIGITPNSLPKLMIVEEALIACYHCRTILIKLRFSNKGRKIGQHALKGNVVNFSQDPESVIKLLDILPLSLESLSNIVIVHFVGSTYPPIESVKMCKLLYVRKFAISTWLN
jgi:hypothetical protein